MKFIYGDYTSLNQTCRMSGNYWSRDLISMIILSQIQSDTEECSN